MSAQDEILIIRHLDHSVLHCPIKLEGKALKAARDAGMTFEDHTDVCQVVFGNKNDEALQHDPPYVYTPQPAMPMCVWKAMLESKQYKGTLGALVKSGKLVPTRHHAA